MLRSLGGLGDVYKRQVAWNAGRCPFPCMSWMADAPTCLLYTSDAADERSSVDLGGRRIIKKKKKNFFFSSRRRHTRCSGVSVGSEMCIRDRSHGMLGDVHSPA